MTKYLSHKLTVIYTILIIMVVYIHSYYPQGEQYAAASFLQNLTGTGICRIANCLFFCLSGYLFARNVEDNKDVCRKVLKRLRTLIVPYLSWNVIFVLWYVALDLLPGASRFNNGSGTLNNYLNQSVMESLYDLFIAPAGFHLWFLRDLLVMVLATPLLCYITRKQWIVSLLLAVLSVTFYPWLVYFWIGIILGMKKVSVENYPHLPEITAAGMLLFLGYAVYIALGGKTNNWTDLPINLIGLYVIWNLYDRAAHGKCCADIGLWKYICGYSFFIYCFHEPTFNVIKKLALAICGTSEPVIIAFYYINPWIMVGISIVTAKLLKLILPKLYNILTGGR